MDHSHKGTRIRRVVRLALTVCLQVCLFILRSPQFGLRILANFFRNLRDVDVDAVGKAMFKHCTSPKALYVTIFERWWIVGLCAVLGACLGIQNIKSAIEKFETHGSILVYQKMPNVLDENLGIPDPKAYDSLFGTHVQLIGSALIVERAIEEHHLHESCPGIEEALDEEEGETFESYIQKNLKIGRAGSGDSAGAFVITVGFGHVVEEECPIVVEAMLETYREYVNESALFDQSHAFELMMERKKTLGEELQQRNQAYRDYLKSAPGVWNRQTQNNPHQQRVEEFKKELTQLELEKVALQSRIEIMSQRFDPVTGEKLSDLERVALIDEDHIKRLEMLTSLRRDEVSQSRQLAYPELQEIESARYDKLLVMQSELAEMRGYLGANHPRIKDAEKAIRDMQELIRGMSADNEIQSSDPRELLDAYENWLKNELKDTRLKIEFVNQTIEQEIKLSHELTDFTIKAGELEADLKRTESLYDSIVAKASKQEFLNEYGNFIAEIVARPHHIEMTWPKKPVILALCVIIGIFFGTFVALALDLIAYTPLRRVFWFVPRWLMGGSKQEIPGESNDDLETDPTAELEKLQAEVNEHLQNDQEARVTSPKAEHASGEGECPDN